MVTHPPSRALAAIRVRGARVHNLRSVDIDIPQGRLVVVTGCSGSGKSSLVFDTIFAEGRRQYLETLSLRARQLFRQLERPDVDLIEGLQPTICIDQFPVARNPRATVATSSELHDYFRVLFARTGVPHCLKCGQPIHRVSPEEIQNELMGLDEETRVVLLAPHVRGSTDHPAQVLADFRNRGYLRARIDGEIVELDSPPEVVADLPHTIELVVDRIIIRPGIEKRMTESIRLALENPFSQLIVLVRRRTEATWRELRFATQFECPDCGFALPAVEPRHFNPSSPYGACPQCEGLGTVEQFTRESVWPNDDKSFAAQPLADDVPDIVQDVESFLKKLRLPPDTPFSQLPSAAQRKLWAGCGRPRFPGLRETLEHRLATTTDSAALERLQSYRVATTCPHCCGDRLGPVGRSVRVGNRTLPDLLTSTIEDASAWFSALSLPDRTESFAPALLEPIRQRLTFLQRVGVGYLTLDRQADSLSGGELQRIRLANAIGTSLSGVCYVLDEPSIGLHPRDNDRLIAALRELTRRGNTVIVVEHDPALIAAADYMIDMGPGAGPDGGEVVACGTVDEVAAVEASPTGRFLRGDAIVSAPAQSAPGGAGRGNPTRWLRIEGVRTNNLKGIDVAVPLQRLVCVTGVSGSGKSSLIHGTLAPALQRELGNRQACPGPYTHLTGVEFISQLITVDQSPLGRNPRSTPATYSGIFDEIRKLFAQTKGARQRGFTARRFSFNHTAGRCETCRGHGQRRIEMGVLADLHVPCDRCGGKRFNRQTLQVRYRHQTIADVLEMPVTEARSFFAEIERIAVPLQRLEEVGLGYLALGQPAHTLSGGEAQRVKLATELARPARGSVLYLLDEPTTGLHLADIQKLLDALRQLVSQGHTVIVIEHHLDVIKSADWVLDLGPEGGDSGGELVVAGPPETLLSCPNSLTGHYLQTVWTPIDNQSHDQSHNR